MTSDVMVDRILVALKPTSIHLATDL